MRDNNLIGSLTRNHLERAVKVINRYDLTDTQSIEAYKIITAVTARS